MENDKDSDKLQQKFTRLLAEEDATIVGVRALVFIAVELTKIRESIENTEFSVPNQLERIKEGLSDLNITIFRKDPSNY